MRAVVPFAEPRPLTLEAPASVNFEVVVPPEVRQFMTQDGAVAPRISRSQALQVPAVLRARNLIAGTLATLPIHVTDDQHNRVNPTRLLSQIDPDVANVVTLAATYEDLLFEGISWWRVRSFDFRGYPAEAEHVPPDRVMIAPSGLPPISSGNGDSRYPVNGRVFIDGREIPDDELIRFDSPNPALLVVAARAIRTCLQLDRTASRYADEPVPLGFFTPKEDGGAEDMDDDEIQKILDSWEVSRRSRAWGYVGAALEVHASQFNAEQIELDKQRQHAVLEIARASGLDPEDLGVSTTSRTYQNSEQRRQDLLDFTLRDYVVAVEQRLSMRDVLPRGYSAKVNLDAFLRSDTKTRMETYEIGKRVGAYTEDEIRALEDRPALTAAQKAANQPPAPAPAAPAATPRPREAANAR